MFAQEMWKSLEITWCYRQSRTLQWRTKHRTQVLIIFLHTRRIINLQLLPNFETSRCIFWLVRAAKIIHTDIFCYYRERSNCSGRLHTRLLQGWACNVIITDRGDLCTNQGLTYGLLAAQSQPSLTFCTIWCWMSPRVSLDSSTERNLCPQQGKEPDSPV
jgi:hypothetical protein